MESEKNSLQGGKNNDHSQRDATAAGHKRTLVTRLYKDSLTSNELNNSFKTSQ
jgi:hypothetical protein